jgi:hypothetical protein
MRSTTSAALLAATMAMTAGCSDRTAGPTGLNITQPRASATVTSPGSRQGFGFNGTASGFPKGVVFLTGGGSFDAATANNTIPTLTTVVNAGGGFRCTEGVEQGLLSGCATGEGVRWDTAQLLASTGFKCTMADTPKTAVTGPGRVVLLADFYRAGNGNDESFTAPMIVSETDLAPLIDGVQNIWIQGVGCGTAVVNFSN